MSSNVKHLQEHILDLSVSSEFCVAKDEWELTDIALREDFTECPCGQPIKELCYMKNKLNGNQTFVGNICINKFVGINTGNLFKGLKKINSNESTNANKDLIEYAYSLGYIYENEYIFLMQTRNKRKLYPKQLAWKQKINRRILKKTIVRRPELKSA